MSIPTGSKIHVVLPDGTSRTASDLFTNVVEKYLADNPAVVPLYDLTNPGPHDEILPVDLLAMNALNAFLGTPPMAPMTLMWEARESVAKHVALVSSKGVEELGTGELQVEADKLEQALLAVEHVKWFGARKNPTLQGTRAAKLIHRLRPNLMPIWDREVAKWYPNQPTWKGWLVRVYEDVREPGTLAGLMWMRTQLPVSLALLRIWDIILWKLKWDGRARR